jgi:hypothetical protein
MELHAIRIDLGKTLFHPVGVDYAETPSCASGVPARNYRSTESSVAMTESTSALELFSLYRSWYRRLRHFHLRGGNASLPPGRRPWYASGGAVTTGTR